MWPNADETRDLLARAKAGDAAAVDDLLARHREPLRRAVDLRIDPALARRLDASDIVQEVLWMRHYEQLGNQEVAAALGLSEAAASMRYLRALRRPRQELLGEEGGPES